MNKYDFEMNDTGRELSERELEQIQGGNFAGDAWRSIKDQGLVPSTGPYLQLVRPDLQRLRARR